MKREKNNIVELIKKIISFSPRQFEGEKKTGEYIKSYFSSLGISCLVQSFDVKIPKTLKASLLVDGIKIDCLGASFSGGRIKDKNGLVSSLMSLSSSSETPNINFNPYSDGISLPVYNWAPSLAISRKDILRFVAGKKINGEVRVEGRKTKSANIILGNIKNPKNIFFCHYDSISIGAIDNASGVAVMMAAIKRDISVLKNNLFVFSGSEELSYDKPYYWGRGYRVFEKKYLRVIKKAKSIVVVDCLGYSPLVIENDWDNILLGFPIVNLNQFFKKTKIITGDFAKLMMVYHSSLDDMRMLQEKYLDEGVRMIIDDCHK